MQFRFCTYFSLIQSFIVKIRRPITVLELLPKSWTHVILVQLEGERFFFMVRYSDEARLKAVLDVLKNGLSENEAARKYGMNHVTVNQWVAA